MSHPPNAAAAEAQDSSKLDPRSSKDASNVPTANYSLQVHGWPTCHHNLSWSADAELAVALDDHVELLLPRVSFAELREQLSPAVLLAEHAPDDDQRTSGRRNTKAAVEGSGQQGRFGARSGAGSAGAVDRPGSTEDGRWRRFSITVNMFKDSEMPMLEPLVFEDMSIGEEQSSSHVTGLAWSAAGLAWNHGCALAVLTANGAVGVWDAVDGKRDMAKQWKRVATVNQAVRRWTKMLDVDNGKPREQWIKREWQTRQRLRARLRAFAWMPVAKGVKGRQMIVVSNDLGELLVLEVFRPHQQSKGFRVEFRAQLNVLEPVASSLPQHSFESFAGPPRCAKSLTCSHLLDEQATGIQKCSIAFTIGTELHWRVCSYRTEGASSSVDFSGLVSRAGKQHLGPLIWHESVRKYHD